MNTHEKIEEKWQSKAAILTALTLLEVISLPVLITTKTLAQTPSIQSQCTDVEIKKHIQQLNKGEPADFNALVACRSKAVPALIKALKENKDENLRIITIALLGEIGSQAAPAVPVLNRLLKDKNQDVRTITVYALRQIGKDPVLPLINSLKHQDSNVRVNAAVTLGLFGTEAKAAIPALTNALKDPDSKVRSAATSALREINKDKLSTQSSNGCVATDVGVQVGIDTNHRVSSNPTNISKNCTVTKVTDNINVSVQVSTTEVGNYIKTNPPIMCKIPAIRAVLRWKCPVNFR
ncbi:HEAT repeat domain-containing protein [Pelatocladus sp. BLCC-F211]|uniref:HEAT repeat domain-containing protein n=1 Tax=Pelatocladus sp. BLCC-F211 TaxID=3342752 RepID=UPI0035B78E32